MKRVHSIKVCDEQPVEIDEDYPASFGVFELLVKKGALDVESDGTHLAWQFTRMSDGHPLTKPRAFMGMPAVLSDLANYVHINDDGQLTLFATDPKQRELQRREQALSGVGIEIRTTGAEDDHFYWWHTPSKTTSAGYSNLENAILSAENFAGYLARYNGEVVAMVQKKFDELLGGTIFAGHIKRTVVAALEEAIQAVRRGES